MPRGIPRRVPWVVAEGDPPGGILPGEPPEDPSGEITPGYPQRNHPEWPYYRKWSLPVPLRCVWSPMISPPTMMRMFLADQLSGLGKHKELGRT